MSIRCRCRTCDWKAISPATAKLHALRRGHEVEVVRREVFLGVVCGVCGDKTLSGLNCLECGEYLCEACWSAGKGRCCE